MSDQTADGGDCFFAEDPELPGCVGYGATAAEAEEQLARARTVYVRHDVVRRGGGGVPVFLTRALTHTY